MHFGLRENVNNENFSMKIKVSVIFYLQQTHHKTSDILPIDNNQEH